MRKIAVLTVLFLALCAWLVLSVDVSAASMPQVTPIPSAEGTAAGGSKIPYLGLLVLLVPFIIMVWKNSRPGAEKVISASTCAPVIDEEALARQREKQDATDAADKA